MAKKDAPEAETQRPSVDPELTRHGGLSYLEIPAVNPRKSAAFYTYVFGWHAEERRADDWRFRDPTGHLIGRWVTGRFVSPDAGLIPYIYVNHVAEAVARALSRDGEVLKSPYSEGNLQVAVIRDPAGNAIGLWQAPSD
jgi:predicted enzyme related to lactoylglutathione lyase